MTQPERRTAPRIATQLPLRLADDHQEIIAHAQNISASGVYCTLSRFIAPMTKLQIQFDLPDRHRSTRIRCQGVVVRAEPAIPNPQQACYNVAIFFNDLSERHRLAIARYVQRHDARSPQQSG